MPRSGRRKQRQRLKHKHEQQAQRKGKPPAAAGGVPPAGGTDGGFDALEEATALAEMLQGTAAHAAAGIRQWCSAQGVAPHPRLEEATEILLLALLPAMAHADAVASGELPESQDSPDTSAAVGQALAMYPPEELEEMKAAVGQVTGFMQSFQDPASMLEAMRISPVDEEQEADGPP